MDTKFFAGPLLGDAVLMLPGLICDQRVFAPQVAGFAHAVAIGGYGSLDNFRDMAEMVLKGAPERFALLGHSMGARIALEIFRMAPERVSGLALVSTGVHAPRDGEAAKRYALRDLGRRDGMEALVDAWLPPMVAPARRHDQAFLRPIRAMCVDAGLSAFEAQTAALLNRPDAESLLPQIQCPTLVAVGSEDAWSPPEQHASFAAMIPRAHFVAIEGAGHMLPLEAPDAFNAAILKWLEHITPIGAMPRKGNTQ